MRTIKLVVLMLVAIVFVLGCSQKDQVGLENNKPIVTSEETINSQTWPTKEDFEADAEKFLKRKMRQHLLKNYRVVVQDSQVIVEKEKWRLDFFNGQTQTKNIDGFVTTVHPCEVTAPVFVALPSGQIFAANIKLIMQLYINDYRQTSNDWKMISLREG
ncbi:MAG: hypothetical protein US57_C0004G0027 [Candidatus Moranbacteria bacterium GW2011_GWC2_37_73]|nr:MAG: hypothetical protein UR95_C0002G0073 [Parcubacteria group bacterium GW2011_GWC1_36_108]KKQ01084.1 MAG: hypothetical protein US09_C0003G0084 [Candidatus Moranbacteria bacterium GW2011_GWD1_36_198]KKQ02486.1 MAG: hypothetical protein US10_C0001G0084 [Candidatus Moranbacteria bacterium GW2011_GWD2_36_198]KKQ40144.1 MAG: hypothetical protein US57_C0004G0027 [Candidatus Moranbacteria bacterium GW2011_GWC2_37_73]HAS00236.1 hypothetical protein [Candidatus Moranbacteria bacterium]